MFQKKKGEIKGVRKMIFSKKEFHGINRFLKESRCVKGSDVNFFHILFLISLPFLFFAACTPAIKESYFCDDYGSQCNHKMEPEHRYQISVPIHKTKSWYEFGYHMYFHTRQTPGIRVNFAKTLTSEEKSKLEKSLECSYSFKKGGKEVKGELEGKRVDDNGFWCFDYLGTMIVKYHKSNETLEEKPVEDFFPAELKLHYKNIYGEGELKGSVFVVWKIE